MPAIVNSLWETSGGGAFGEEREHKSGLGVGIAMKTSNKGSLKGAAKGHQEGGVVGQASSAYLTLVRRLISATMTIALGIHLSHHDSQAVHLKY